MRQGGLRSHASLRGRQQGDLCWTYRCQRMLRIVVMRIVIRRAWDSKKPQGFSDWLRKSERAPMQTHEVENSYGSVLVSINFCSWIYPLATASMPASTT
jgi:hypothetical protein